MENNGSNSSLSKLIPKAIASKRLRRKQHASRDSDLGDDGSANPPLSHRASTLGSEDTASSHMTGDDDDHDDHSFASRESGIDQDQNSIGSRGRSPGPTGTIESPSRPSDPPAINKSSSTPSKRFRLASNTGILSPETPPNLDKPTPAIFSTPPTPTDSSRPVSAPSADAKPPSLADGKSIEQNIAAHRRSRSGSAGRGPSKLSNVTAAPLSPTLEADEPASNSSNTSFFSSMLSAAQNAANNITNNIQTSSIGLGGNKARSTPTKPLPQAPANHVEVEPAPEAKPDNGMDEKESAVRTLGAGDLSLSHLGFSDPISTVASPSTPKFPDLVDTRARSESAPADAPPAYGGDYPPEEAASRPRSLQDVNDGDRTPPLPDLLDKSGMQRSSSIRSAVKPQRHRGSSVTTGAGVALGLTTSAGATVAHPNANFSTPKLTGFAIASKKRNRDFHTLFKSVPDDDYLIEDYSCALQREILAHGRLYVSEGHLCFSSNILGWTTTLVMSFDEIVSVEKRSTALLFKNGLMISTLHAKHIFASFTSRDATYDLIVNIWKLGHPTLTSTLNGVRLEGTGGDKTEKLDADHSGPESDPHACSETDDDSEDDEDDYYDEEHDGLPDTQITDLSLADGEAEKTVGRKPSGMTASNGAPGDQGAGGQPAAGATDFPGPATHAPTECGDSDKHYDKFIADDVIPAPLGKVYSLVFGAASPVWLSKWLTEEQKCTDLSMEDKKGLSLENRSRVFSYIKPLGGSIGPKQTKCIVSETVETLDYEKAINLSSSTQTPDVPGGNVFSVKTRYCLSWAENNATRVQVSCTIEWTGKSWLKGPIEKGCVDGQMQYAKEISASLRAAVAQPRAGGAVANGVSKGKKKGKKSKAQQPTTDVQHTNSKANGQAKQNWGPLEPLRDLLEPISDALRPVFTGNILYGILVGLLVAAWFGFGFTPGKNGPGFRHGVGMYTHERHMMYDAIWHLEEHELWDWLEERVGLERLNSEGPAAPWTAPEPQSPKQRVVSERMQAQELVEAVKVTEAKLKMLKSAIENKDKDEKQDAREDSDGLVGEEIA